MNGFLTRACAVAAAGVVLGTWMAAAASASGGGGARIRHGALSPAGVAAGRSGALRLTHNAHATGRAAARAVSNRTFAGYQTTVATGSATTSVASFTVPALSCTTADRAILPDTGIASEHAKPLARPGPPAHFFGDGGPELSMNVLRSSLTGFTSDSWKRSA